MGGMWDPYRSPSRDRQAAPPPSGGMPAADVEALRSDLRRILGDLNQLREDTARMFGDHNAEARSLKEERDKARSELSFWGDRLAEALGVSGHWPELITEVERIVRMKELHDAC